MNIIKKEKLESLLISHWTEILELRKVMEFTQQHTTTPIHKISISRFEYSPDGFILWIEYNSSKTIEALLTSKEIKFLNDA